MKLAAGVIFYQDVKSLKRCLDSLFFVDTVFCIDGKFPMYPDGPELSTDGSAELVLSYNNTVLVNYPASEVDKRNKYLELAKDYDWLLIIDSDEWVLEAYQEALDEMNTIKDGNIFCVNFINLGNGTEAPRLWRKPGEMEYLEAHNIFKKKNSGEITRSTAGGPLIEGIIIAADDKLRTRDREEKATKYQEKLIAHEKVIKFKYGFRSSPI